MSGEQIKPIYKQTEVGVIPADWMEYQLLDATERISVGLATSVTKYYRQEGLPIIRNMNIKDGYFDDSELLYLATEFARENQSKSARGLDVLTVHTGSNLGQSCVLPEQFDGCQTFTTLITTPRKTILDSRFLCYHMSSLAGRKEMDRLQVGGGKGNLNTGDLKRYRIALGSLNEQRAIVSALSDVDALLAKIDKLIVKKRDLKQATMQQLLIGQTRLPGFSGEWKVKRLGEICHLEMGRTPSRANQSYWGQGYKWLSIADLKGKVIQESNEEITEFAAKEMRIIPKGTLLMSFKLSIGRLAFAGCDLFTNEAICSFNDLEANANYLYYALGRIDFSLYGKQAVKGYTLNKSSLRTVELSLPSTDEQTAIATVLSDMDAELAALEARRDKARALKQGMMQELLTGKIRLI